MDACTVTTPDAITAFAVPNPNCSSQSQSVFSGLLLVAGDHGAHGVFDDRAQQNSYEVWADLNRSWLGIATVLGTCAGLFFALKSRS